jgi:hypothetical protein
VPSGWGEEDLATPRCERARAYDGPTGHAGGQVGRSLLAAVTWRPPLLWEGTLIGIPYRHLWEFFGGQMHPWDRGVLDAHWINAGSSAGIREHLRKADRQRRGLLALLFPWRRRYLDGLIWGLKLEVERRSR